MTFKVHYVPGIVGGGKDDLTSCGKHFLARGPNACGGYWCGSPTKMKPTLLGDNRQMVPCEECLGGELYKNDAAQYDLGEYNPDEWKNL